MFSVAFATNLTLNYFNITTEDLLGHLERFYNDKNISNNIQSEILTKNIKKENGQPEILTKGIEEENGQLAELNQNVSNGVSNMPDSCGITMTLWEGKSDFDTNNQVSTLNNFLLTEDAKYNKRSADPILTVGQQNIYNRMTTNAVKSFQRNYDIEVTGNVGPETLAKINSILCNYQNNGPILSFSSTPVSKLNVDSYVGNSIGISVQWNINPKMLEKINADDLMIKLLVVNERNELVADAGNWTYATFPKITGGINPYNVDYSKNQNGKVRLKAIAQYNNNNKDLLSFVNYAFTPAYSDWFVFPVNK